MVNTGPDFVTNAVVTIDWPIETVSGKHLLYLMDIQVSRSVSSIFEPHSNYCVD